MSTIPNRISSERSTAQSMDVPIGSTSQGSYEGYDDRPILGDGGRGGFSARDAHVPAHGRKTTMTAEGTVRDYHPYPPSVRESGSGSNSHKPDGLETHAPYSSFSARNPANQTSHPPPPSDVAGALRRTPNSHPPHPPIATLDTPSPTASSQGSKKRKGTYESAQQTTSGTTMSSPTTSTFAGSSSTTNQPSKEAVKRTKTSRACDPCRRKKIRCDVIQNSDPPICAHCKQYGFDCTFFLPITETRWKKRKFDEEEGATSSSPTQKTSLPKVLTRQDSGPSTPSSTLPVRRTSSDAHALNTPGPSQRTDARIYGAILANGSGTIPFRAYLSPPSGPTSLTYILHSSSTMPAVDSFDLRYHQTWRVGRSGEGFIQVHEQEDQNMQEDDDSPQDADGATRPGTRRQDTVERDVLEKLINYYFKHIAPMFPVITEHEFLHGIDEEEEPPSGGRANGFSRQPGRQASPKRDDRSHHTYEPPPVLLYAICTITATARHVPSRVFDSLRIMLNSVIRSEDVMSTATLSNIQALLIAGMTAEAHGRAPGQAMSAAWLRVSAAIRMAQDLGLHRAEAVKANIQLRRRLWAACVISDRWFALTLGLPFIIDVHDCDARLPGPDYISAHADGPMTHEQAKSMLFMGEFVKLSVLCGKVMKTIYGPTGLIHTTDEILERLQDELEKFTPNLPSELTFRGKDSDIFAGLIQLCHCCIGLLFWRVFARIQYTMPAHLKFAITVEAWTALTIESAKAIEWLDTHETLYDSWFIVGYSLTSCALVQYHTWARRSDEEAQASLKQARDCAKRWDRAIDAGHMLTRRKTTEIISLLYEATQNPVPRNFWPLNPTAGVEARNSASADAIVFRKDPMRPGGGLFLATSRTASALGEDMPDGTLVVPDVPNIYVPPSDGPRQDTVMSDETIQVGPDNPGWARDPSVDGTQHPSALHTTPMLLGERESSSTMSNMNPNLPSSEKGGTPYGAHTLQGQPADSASYAAGGFIVPIPNYQHPYYVPDYNLPLPPPLPRLHGHRDYCDVPSHSCG